MVANGGCPKAQNLNITFYQKMKENDEEYVRSITMSGWYQKMYSTCSTYLIFCDLKLTIGHPMIVIYQVHVHVHVCTCNYVHSTYKYENDLLVGNFYM